MGSIICSGIIIKADYKCGAFFGQIGCYNKIMEEVMKLAHAICPDGHDMWNGDGKPVVWAFRVGFLRDFIKTHPGCKLGEESEHWQMYDCVDDVPGEDLDCWYCDECKSLVVYAGISRYDFKRMESLPDVKLANLDGWEEYIALRDREFEDFQEFYKGKNPIEAIEQYDFAYRYMLSPDRKTIYALDREGKIAFGYFKSNYTEFSPECFTTRKSQCSKQTRPAEKM